MNKICIVLDHLRSAHNTGNIYRLAEAVGAAEIIACGYTPSPPHPKLEKTAMGADKLVPCRQVADLAEAVKLLRSEGYRQILAAEPGGMPAWEMSYEFPLALVFGNEALGVDPAGLPLLDGVVSLPMAGEKASINVSNAAAAVIYAVIAKKGF